MRFFLAAMILQIPAYSENVREAPANLITEQTAHVTAPDKQGLTWFAPELHSSRYRSLFFGYDTLDYRLAAPENPGSSHFSLGNSQKITSNTRHRSHAPAWECSNRCSSVAKHKSI